MGDWGDSIAMSHLCLFPVVLIGFFCVASTFPVFDVGQGIREDKDKELASC
jgi:hypothetical protein